MNRIDSFLLLTLAFSLFLSCSTPKEDVPAKQEKKKRNFARLGMPRGLITNLGCKKAQALGALAVG